MSDKSFCPASGESFEVKRQANGSLEVKKPGEKKGVEVSVESRISSVDFSTKRLHASWQGGKKLFWIYSRGNKRVLSWPGGSMELDASDLTEGSGGSGGALKPLKLTMPGKVLSVKVKAGDLVAPGQGLVIVEAMKMENLLLAAAPARVAKVHVKEGDRLESGATLISFEAAP